MPVYNWAFCIRFSIFSDISESEIRDYKPRFLIAIVPLSARVVAPGEGDAVPRIKSSSSTGSRGSKRADAPPEAKASTACKRLCLRMLLHNIIEIRL